MSRWAALDDELARWRDVGRDAVLWWRDDDAAEMTPALDRLLELQRATSAPLSLAVVPARATEALAQRLVHEPGIDLLQHGYAHVNNTHLDLIDWKGGRGFIGIEAALDTMVRALQMSRTSTGEPVGLLSHHLAMDGETWEFLESMLGRAQTMPGLKIEPAHDLFASREARV